MTAVGLVPQDGADTYAQAGMIRDAISRSVKAIIIVHDDMAIGASVVGKSLNRTLFVTGLNGQTATLEAVADNEIQTTIDTSPYAIGQVAVQVSLDSIAGEFSGGWA